MENSLNYSDSLKPTLLGKVWKRLSFWLRNKYFIAVGVFAAILLFFDKNDVFTQATRKNQLRDLLESKQYYTDRIAAERKELELLKSNPATIEKYAREKYLMKRSNEDLYLIPKSKTADNR
ncbi:MAG: FtsB family cell division protein [Chitinophagaceae bacterium]